MIPQPRNTAGTRFFTDALEDGWRGLRGGDPATAERDLSDLRQGLPLRAVAHLRHGRFLRQGLLVMHLAAPERLTWRRWRPLRPYAEPISVPSPREVLDVRGPSSFLEFLLGDVRVVSFRAGDREWEMAVVTIDTTVVTTALTEAEAWTP
ncbi:hypothetical protein [Nocardiopsis lucentensis]|uniref:hypothetical protein n=1 Tax=Nocardiopsis lucentensis TaxID=53441 RepID=UPI0003460AB3|nr:hypothetical protein [Nocardiopsis lucentensis]